jgi:hypothetical protein
MTVKEYMKSIGLNLDAKKYYLKKNCEILDSYGDKGVVLAASRTFYSAVFLFIRAKRVAAFTIATPFYNSYWHGTPEDAGLGALETGRSTVEIGRLQTGTPDKVEKLLSFIKHTNESEFGQGFIVDDIDSKLNPEVIRKSKKTFLGEVMRKTFTKNYGYNNNNSSGVRRTVRVRSDGDPMPFGMQDQDVRERNTCYGYFLCKNGNIICYSRGGYYSNNSTTQDETGDEYGQGPGNMVHPKEALSLYKLGQDPTFMASQPTSYCDEMFQYKTLFELEEKMMDQLQTQILCRGLEDSSKGSVGSYYGGVRIEDPMKDTWIPKQ